MTVMGGRLSVAEVCPLAPGETGELQECSGRGACTSDGKGEGEGEGEDEGDGQAESVTSMTGCRHYVASLPSTMTPPQTSRADGRLRNRALVRFAYIQS